MTNYTEIPRFSQVFCSQNKRKIKIFEKTIDKTAFYAYYLYRLTEPIQRITTRREGETMVLGKVKTILSNQFDVDEAELNEDTRLDDDLGADSLDVVDLMMSLEDTFDVEIQDEDIEKIRTVGDLVAYIEEHL